MVEPVKNFYNPPLRNTKRGSAEQMRTRRNAFSSFINKENEGRLPKIYSKKFFI